ncbi:hypothetical protein PIB30_059974 [Stylosanthes scabra]|uniref:Secreted protein n=1 Tax=Stylosanthes scabra TaxID=79078 RepID=A0ABU6XIB1_9FABA|nr:hypothetical protein [Stylosanthes scabra]
MHRLLRICVPLLATLLCYPKHHTAPRICVEPYAYAWLTIAPVTLHPPNIRPRLGVPTTPRRGLPTPSPIHAQASLLRLGVLHPTTAHHLCPSTPRRATHTHNHLHPPTLNTKTKLPHTTHPPTHMRAFIRICLGFPNSTSTLGFAPYPIHA